MKNISLDLATLIDILVPFISAIAGAIIGGMMSVRGAREAAEISMNEQRQQFDENKAQLDEAQLDTVRKTASIVLSEILSWIKLSAQAHNINREVPLTAIDFNDTYREYLSVLIPYLDIDQVMQITHFYGHTKRLSLILINAQVSDANGISQKTTQYSGYLLNNFFSGKETDIIRRIPYNQLSLTWLLTKASPQTASLIQKLNAVSGMNIECIMAEE